MSVSASIDFVFNGAAFQTAPRAVFDRLTEFGWRVTGENGVLHLPLGDLDEFDWTERNLTLAETRELLDSKVRAKEIAGISLTVQSENIGGEFLFLKTDLLSFCPSINRKKLVDSQCTDFGWYIERIVPALIKDSTIHVASIVATEVR